MNESITRPNLPRYDSRYRTSVYIKLLGNFLLRHLICEASYFFYLQWRKFITMFGCWNNWRKYRFLNRPTRFQTIKDTSTIYTTTFDPSAQAQSFAINSQKTIVPLIAALLLIRRPSTVAWLVVTCISNTFQSHTDWTRSHVGQKGHKIIDPFWRYSDTASAIISVSLILAIKTTALRTGPLCIFAAPMFTPTSMPMVHNMLFYNKLYEKST